MSKRDEYRGFRGVLNEEDKTPPILRSGLALAAGLFCLSLLCIVIGGVLMLTVSGAIGEMFIGL